jgi:hypothetical protein
MFTIFEVVLALVVLMFMADRSYQIMSFQKVNTTLN